MLIFPILIASGVAWSEEGHAVVARLAYKLMSTSAQSLVVDKFFKSDTPLADFVEASAWADKQTTLDEFPGSAELHFANTAYRLCEAGFVMDRDCPDGRCIVGGILKYLGMATDMEESTENRIIATKFLIHLIADLHQPLHLGFARDRGGTLIHVDLEDGSHLSLHEVWDFDLLSRYIKSETREELVNRIFNNIRSVSPPTNEDWASLFVGIADKIVKQYTCAMAYKDLRHREDQWIEAGDKISADYLKVRQVTVIKLLVDASTVLANVMDHIAQVHKNARDEVRRVQRELAVFPTAIDESPESLADANRFACLEIDEDFDEASILALNEAVSDDKSVTAIVRLHKREYEPNIFEGVDLADILLMKHPMSHHLMLTSRRLRREGIANKYFVVIQVRFRNRSKPFQFGFDKACFGLPPYSDELVKRALDAVRGKPSTMPLHRAVESVEERFKTRYQVQDSLESSDGVTLVGGPRTSIEELYAAWMPFRSIFASAHEERIPFNELERLSAIEAHSKKDSVVCIKSKALIFCTTIEALDDRAPVHATLICGFEGDVVFAYLLDKRLCASFPGADMLEAITRYSDITRRRNPNLLREKRPLLAMELDDLGIYLFDLDGDRWARFKTIDYLLDIEPSDSNESVEIIWKVGDPRTPVKRSPG